MRKKILVTGGAGFIGGNFIHYMLNNYSHYEIWNLDKLTYAGDLAKHKNIEAIERYHFVKGDIADTKAVLSLFVKEEFNYVVHFAAESHVDRSIQEPSVFMVTNILGTQSLLEAAKYVGVERFIHVSTDEVYGDLDFTPHTFFTEDSPLKPNSPYSASKASSDLLVRAYHETFDLPSITTRCSNNYGPYQFPEKLIPLTILRVLNDERVPIYGDGRNVRDWLHVTDHCRALDLILHKGCNGEVYNIGGHNERNNLDVAKRIIDVLGKSDDLIEFVADRPGHDRRYAIDPTKISGLGWVPAITFESGMSGTINWYLENEWWWKPLINGE